MWAQLTPWIKEQARRLARWLGLAAVLLAGGAMALWRRVRPYLIFALNVLVALVLLFEEWGWRPLSSLVAQLARFRVWALLELWIAGLPPYGALVALGVPSAILVPAKLFGVYLLALGHVVSAAFVLVAAKLASTALIARIFILTKPALMQIGWFQRAYDIFVPWQEALFAWVRGTWVWRYGRIVKWRVNGTLRRTWRVLRPNLAASWAALRPKAIAFGRRLPVHARDLWSRTSLAGERLWRRLQGPSG
jgi:hypothetical protein